MSEETNASKQKEQVTEYKAKSNRDGILYKTKLTESRTSSKRLDQTVQLILILRLLMTLMTYD